VRAECLLRPAAGRAGALPAGARQRRPPSRVALLVNRPTPWARRLAAVACLAASLAGVPAGPARADAPSVGGLRPSAPAAAYDPLRLPDAPLPAPLDLTVRDPKRDREIPLRVWLPAGGTPGSTPAPAGVIVFSHGLGGSREGYAYVGRHWAARGYVVVHPQHVGSDDGVWKDVPPERRLAALKQAANIPNFIARADDVRVVLDALERWNAEPGHPLHGRLDVAHVGMAGHSFGAVTTQAVSGESFPLAGTRYTDPRIRAALPMSPSAPRRGEPAKAFGGVSIPWLMMTGTNDVAPIGDATLESRLAVYRALPPGSKYELVLDGAEHSAFSDRALPGDRAPRDPAHHRAILALSTAFWDAYLRDDEAARAWLDGAGPRSVLAPADVWQRK
jgi:predicted dienelactone hydrolase